MGWEVFLKWIGYTLLTIIKTFLSRLDFHSCVGCESKAKA